MKIDKKLFLFGALIFLLCLVFYFFINDSLVLFGFSGDTLFNGEIWRIITFNFVHVDMTHLIGNLIALIITLILAYELELSGIDFLFVFFVSGIIIALIESLILPYVMIAGASLGIYAVLGAITLKGKKFMPQYYFIILILFSVLMNYMFTCKDCLNTSMLLQAIFHLCGFFIGLGIYSLILYEKKIHKINAK